MPVTGTFTVDVTNWIASARGKGDFVLRKICFEIFRRVILKTPVDTGRARNNWQAAVNFAHIDKMEEGEFDRSGASSLQRATQAIIAAKLGQDVYFTNNLPYIGRLEEGWSKQAPAGMLMTTLQEFPGLVRMAVSEAQGSGI